MDALSDVLEVGGEGPGTVHRSVRPTRICFVAPSAYPVLAGDRSIQRVGGAEVQQCILAREFTRRGYEVSMVCLNHGQPDVAVVDGVTVYRAHTPDEGLPVVRFVHPRLTSIWAAMRRADADIYYQRSAAAMTAFVVAFAKRHGRRSVFAAASDRDFLPDTPHVALARDRWLYRWGLNHADHVVAQTPLQQDGFQRSFGRASALIRSCYASREANADREGPVIWVSNLLPVKRAELFVELAKRLPQYAFRLIGGGDDERLGALRRIAASVPNLELTGFVPFADIESQFDGAAVLVNTSSNEGFPNTFLQAWSRGLPTVSFFNSQAVHDGAAVSMVSDSLDEMVSHVKRLKEDASLWASISSLARAYFERNLSVADAVDGYESMLGCEPLKVDSLRRTA
jgi:glycosyltransferase involved in cell wall biosynthesis